MEDWEGVIRSTGQVGRFGWWREKCKGLEKLLILLHQCLTFFM